MFKKHQIFSICGLLFLGAACGPTASSTTPTPLDTGNGNGTGDGTGTQLTAEEQAEKDFFSESFILHDGSTYNIADLKGQGFARLVISFGADWCNACHNEQSELEEIAGRDDVAVLMMLFEDGANEAATERTMTDWQGRHELEAAKLTTVSKEFASQFFSTGTAPYNALLDLEAETFETSGTGSTSLNSVKAILGE